MTLFEGETEPLPAKSPRRRCWLPARSSWAEPEPSLRPGVPLILEAAVQDHLPFPTLCRGRARFEMQLSFAAHSIWEADAGEGVKSPCKLLPDAQIPLLSISSLSAPSRPLSGGFLGLYWEMGLKLRRLKCVVPWEGSCSVQPGTSRGVAPSPSLSSLFLQLEVRM